MAREYPVLHLKATRAQCGCQVAKLDILKELANYFPVITTGI